MFKWHYPGGTAALKSAYFSVLDEKAPGWTSTITFVYVMNYYQLVHVTFTVMILESFTVYLQMNLAVLYVLYFC